LVAACAATYFLFMRAWRMRRLIRVGIVAPGVITHKRLVERKTPMLYLGYRFATPDGREHQAEQRIWSLDWDRARQGQTVTVLHWPGRERPSVIYEFARYQCVSGVSRGPELPADSGSSPAG
jgi:hypothetical protein